MRAVFLDRDGVINRKAPDGLYVTRWEDFEFLPGAAPAIRLLNENGYLVLVITNQRCVARGLLTEGDLANIHRLMVDGLSAGGARVDGIYYCPHDLGVCTCRKPQTGLFLKAGADFPAIDFKTSFVIGDSSSDIEAGKALSCWSILISASSTPSGQSGLQSAIPTATSLYEAVINYIL